MKKPMIWKEEDGTKYKISFSERIQIKNLDALRRQLVWEKRNFYAKMILMILFGIFAASILFLLYRLDSVDFFMKILGRL